MNTTYVFGIAISCLAALTWGSADFSGGFATRRGNVAAVLFVTSLVGVAGLALISGYLGEALPGPRGLVMGGVAGLLGAVGLGALYQGLSLGNASLVAPTAAVVGAVLPVVVGIAMDGLPGWTQSAGIAFGVGGIWLVTRPTAQSRSARRVGLSLALALTAGVCFGVFFILLAEAGKGGLYYTPILVSKTGSTLVALAAWLGIWFLRPGSGAPTTSVKEAGRLPGRWVFFAFLSGVLDAAGNVCFLVGKHLTRLDVATVLSSMYPVFTVIWATTLLSEKVSRSQWLGIGLCLWALALIAW